MIGAAGLVIGFALQGTLSNFASGLLIMIYRPFDVGDVIEAAGAKGKVEGMTLVTTLIRTMDNQSVYIPNNTVWGRRDHQPDGEPRRGASTWCSASATATTSSTPARS